VTSFAAALGDQYFHHLQFRPGAIFYRLLIAAFGSRGPPAGMKSPAGLTGTVEVKRTSPPRMASNMPTARSARDLAKLNTGNLKSGRVNTVGTLQAHQIHRAIDTVDLFRVEHEEYVGIRCCGTGSGGDFETHFVAELPMRRLARNAARRSFTSLLVHGTGRLLRVSLD
jgi:hypothetical protein